MENTESNRGNHCSRRSTNPKWRVWLFYGLILAFGLGLAACGAGSAPPTEIFESSPVPAASATASSQPTAQVTGTPAIPGVVTLWLNWNPDEMRALEGIIEAYQSMHPGARFRLVYFPPGQLRPALDGEIEPDAQPSLVFGPSDWGDQLLADGIVRDVSQVILPELRESLHPFALAQVERNESLVGLPLELQGTVLYRNRNLAAEPANTVARMVEASQQARLEGSQGSSFDLGFRNAAPMVRTCRGQIVSDPEVVPIDQPAGLCWLRLLDRLGRAGPVTFDSAEDLNLFQAGETLWLLDSTSQMIPLQQVLGEDVLTIDPWPLYEATGESLLGSVWTENAYFFSQSSDQDFEAAWSFASYLLAPDNQLSMAQARGVGHLPALADVELDDPLLMQASRALDTGIPQANLAVDEQVRRELFTAVRLVVADGGDPELALGLALEEIRQARIPTSTPTSTPTATLSPTPSNTPIPTPPPG